VVCTERVDQQQRRLLRRALDLGVKSYAVGRRHGRHYCLASGASSRTILLPNVNEMKILIEAVVEFAKAS
jgi:hypothetical protein